MEKGLRGARGMDLANLRVRWLAEKRIWRQIRVDIYEPREFLSRSTSTIGLFIGGVGFIDVTVSLFHYFIPSLFILQRVPKNWSRISYVFICWKRGIFMKLRVQIGEVEQTDVNDVTQLFLGFTFYSRFSWIVNGFLLSVGNKFHSCMNSILMYVLYVCMYILNTYVYMKTNALTTCNWISRWRCQYWQV